MVAEVVVTVVVVLEVVVVVGSGVTRPSDRFAIFPFSGKNDLRKVDRAYTADTCTCTPAVSLPSLSLSHAHHTVHAAVRSPLPLDCGQYQMYVNGHRVGAYVCMLPGWP